MQQLTSETLAAACRHLTRKDRRFAPILKRHGVPSLRAADPDFRSLLTIVVEQFLSLKAAQAIWIRIESELSPLTPESIAAIAPEKLRALGLSHAKANAFIGIAQAVNAGRIDLQHLPTLPDGEVRKCLLSLPGIGPWSADIFLLANLSRPDVFPAGDLALQIAAQHLLGLPDRPDTKAMSKIAEAWSPYRAVAARLLWSHYRDIKSLPQA